MIGEKKTRETLRMQQKSLTSNGLGATGTVKAHVTMAKSSLGQHRHRRFSRIFFPV